jgi:hypothetical protein
LAAFKDQITECENEVIRYKQLGSVGEFEKFVNELLAEMETKKTAAK